MSKIKILVIEDDRPMCWLLDRILGDSYDVTFTHGTISAMQLLSDGNLPDLLLCDYVLPNMNGLDFLEYLKISGAYSEIPVIIFSVMKDEEFINNCLDKGAAGYLEKPFDPPKLLDEIQKVIQVNGKKKTIVKA